MRIHSPAAALSLACGSAAAQEWTGGYVSSYAGALMDPDDSGDTVQFDTNPDGGFGDCVNTAASANAFSLSFCDGAAGDRMPAGGCRENGSGGDYGIRGGDDWLSGNLVFGVLREYGMADCRDAVSAFSTTPPFYTLLRKVDDTLAVRGRIGMTFGDGNNLAYGTAGYARSTVENDFSTSHAVNTFVNNGDSDADGYPLGVGNERRSTDSFSLGVEYLHSRIDDEDYRVRA
ncbi:MAG: outer membrane beta-barrel protein [Rhodanobacteraceae bacterium]|nr:outer membrane beta-barrel protein [Rhodanobacteraceae bacterium]